MFSNNTEEYSSYNLVASRSEKIQLMVKRHFMSLIGLELDYYGADAGGNTFKVDDIVFKVLEDPSDGYRSMLGAIDYTNNNNSIFFQTPIAKVYLKTYDIVNDEDREMSTNEQGYSLVDIVDDHVWLEFGTHNYDDYYPMFIFRHNPKSPNENR